MIRVQRDAVEVPPVIDAEDDGKARGGKASAAKEARKAKASFEKWKAEGKDQEKWSYDFSIYKHKDVKKALTDLFHGKCAYCETRYAATQPMDVEHWRPKGRVELEDGSQRKPAYYWLAADWDNLLPSCIDCNRLRKQIDAVTQQEISLGKLDRFPLADESARAKDGGEEAQEEPLLLDPCRDDPAEYLAYLGDSRAPAVVAPRERSGLARDKALASIRVYGLNRSMLVLNRNEYLEMLKLRIATITGLGSLLVDYPDLPDGVVTAIEDVILNEMRALERAREDPSRYALLARQIIDRHKEELGLAAPLGP